MNDPLESEIARALDCAGIGYVTDEGGNNPTNLDFRLHNGVEIEVKRFHSPRIAEQMARAENVIAIQGAEAVHFFAELLVASVSVGEAAVEAVARAMAASVFDELPWGLLYDQTRDDYLSLARAAIAAIAALEK